MKVNKSFLFLNARMDSGLITVLLSTIVNQKNSFKESDSCQGCLLTASVAQFAPFQTCDE